MKKLLTVISIESAKWALETAPQDVEILCRGNEDRLQFIKNSAKAAKGKYVYVANTAFGFGDIAAFFDEAENAGADALTFENGCLFKSSVLKGVFFHDGIENTADIFAAMESKSVAQISSNPIIPERKKLVYTEEWASSLSVAVEEFKRNKAKLCKEAYTLAFDLILKNLVNFYICVMLEIYGGKLAGEYLTDFDTRLKENIVLYLALEKRFTAEKLQKLRAKNFKIGFFTALKFKKLV